jgi:hypothetical protein
VDEKINILMVDDQPGKLLSYEVLLPPEVRQTVKTLFAVR